MVIPENPKSQMLKNILQFWRAGRKFRMLLLPMWKDWNFAKCGHAHFNEFEDVKYRQVSTVRELD